MIGLEFDKIIVRIWRKNHLFDVLLSHAAEAVTQHNYGPPQDSQQNPIRIPQSSAPGAAIENIRSSETMVMG